MKVLLSAIKVRPEFCAIGVINFAYALYYSTCYLRLCAICAINISILEERGECHHGDYSSGGYDNPRVLLVLLAMKDTYSNLVLPPLEAAFLYLSKKL